MVGHADIKADILSNLVWWVYKFTLWMIHSIPVGLSSSLLILWLWYLHFPWVDQHLGKNSVSIFSIPKKWLLPNHGLTLTLAKKKNKSCGSNPSGWLVDLILLMGFLLQRFGTLTRRHTLSKKCENWIKIPRAWKSSWSFFILAARCLTSSSSKRSCSALEVPALGATLSTDRDRSRLAGNHGAMVQ